MVAATILALMFFFSMNGGGPFGQFISEYVEDPIEEVVADKTRRGQALGALEKLQDDIEDFNEEVLGDIEALNDLVDDYDSTPADFDKMTDAVLQKHHKEFDTMWQHRSEMLSHIKADEWQTIVAKAEAAQKSDR